MSDSKIMSMSYPYPHPVSLVFAYWTEPELLSTWWGVAGSVVVDCTIELRVGGHWSITMRARSGRVFHSGGIYLAVEAPRVLKFSDVPVADLPEWSGLQRHDAIHTVVFAEVDGGTRVDLRTQFETVAERQLMERLGMADGMMQGLRGLADILANAGTP
ncbi:uncharacterized protein YndB with AHSA1/START domain [Devosia sp. UYZn731]|uniref:SRPBCC family protein n=1 Tax=Devosia sp. UYZn731 TaxID=3156345 RepID=UPI00339B179B